jgi:hypothetical protein
MKCLNSVLISKLSSLTKSTASSTVQNNQKLKFLNKFYSKNQLEFQKSTRVKQMSSIVNSDSLIEDGKRAAAHKAIDDHINAVR